MVQQYDPEHLYDSAQKEADPIFRLHGRQAPPPMQGESFVKYDRRLTDELKRYAPNFKDVNLNDSGGHTYPILKKQVFAEAEREAHCPTMVPDGELREINALIKADDLIPSSMARHAVGWICSRNRKSALLPSMPR